MKRTFLGHLFIVIVLALGLVACDTRQDQDDVTIDRDAERGIENETDTYTARDYYFFDDSRDYTYDERNEFREDLVEARNKLDMEITRLEAEMDNVNAETRDEYKDHVDNLKEERDELDQKINEIDGTTEDNWEEFKDGVKSTWNDIEDGYKEIRDDVRGEEGDVIDLDNEPN
jgi:chromosome segregation ATPase